MSSALAGMRGSTGEADGAALYQRDLQRRAEFSQPQDKYALGDDQRQRDIKDAYNRAGMHIDTTGGPPVKYTTDTPEKDYMVTRQNVRDGIQQAADEAQIANPAVIRTDPITDQEVAYRKQMDDVGELARFEAYVRAGWGGRDKMDMILKEYPQLIAREVDQINTDAKYALRCKLIDLYGCRDFDDIHFQYARDHGLITGPRLMSTTPIDSQYQGGVMSPYTYARRRSTGGQGNREGLMLPYTVVNEGPRAPTNLGDIDVPLGNLLQTNSAMYNSDLQARRPAQGSARAFPARNTFAT